MAQLMVNLQRNPETQKEPYPLDEFIPKVGDQAPGFFDPQPFPKKAPTAEELQRANEQALALTFAGLNKVAEERRHE